jgi:NADH-quinone oxidoreductase subunit A
MSPLTDQSNALWPLLVYLTAVVGLILAMMGLSHVLGGRTKGRLRDQPFESGVIPVGDARLRFSAKFYLVAIFFVLFDLEAVFLFAWGIAAIELGWAGYAGAMIFLFILTVALIYEWRIGALDWAPKSPPRRTSPARSETAD